MRSLLIVIFGVVGSGGFSQVLLDLNDSLMWSQYGASGVSKVEVFTQLVNDGEKGEELRKYSAELNEKGQLVTYQKFKGKSLALKKKFSYNSRRLLQLESDKKGHHGIVNTVEYAYDSSDRVTRRTRKIGERVIATEYSSYNNDGTLLNQAYVTEKDSGNTLFKHKYDSLGRLVEKTSLYPEYDDYYTVYYEFDDTGKSYTMYDWSEEQGKKRVASYEYGASLDSLTVKRYSRSGQLVSSHSYFYEPSTNQCIAEYVRDERNATDFYIDRTFDKKERLKEEIGYYYGKDNSDYHFKQGYTCKSQLKYVKHYDDGGRLIKKAKYAYDKKGNTLGHKLYKEGNLYLIVRYEYIYY